MENAKKNMRAKNVEKYIPAKNVGKCKKMYM
jgi:hypothetical protein